MKRSKPPEPPVPQEIGPDGWPIEDDTPCRLDPPTDRREELFQRDLAACERAWLAGNFPALFEAVVLCGEHKRPLPLWASRAVLRILADQFNHGAPGSGGGRHTVPRTEHVENYKHFMRWDAVRELRDRRHELRELERHLRDLQGEPVESTETGWDHVYDTVADYLANQNSIAKGSPSTIKRSYQLVEAAMRNGTGAKFYQTRFFNPERKK